MTSDNGSSRDETRRDALSDRRPDGGPFGEGPTGRRYAEGTTPARVSEGRGDLDRVEANDPAADRAQDAQDNRPRTDAKPYRAAGPVLTLLTVLLGFLVALLLLIFLAQNARSIPITFLWMTTNANFAIVTLIIAFIAVVVVEIIAAMWRHHHRRVLNERAQLRAYRSRQED